MERSRKLKRISWAPDVNLCQVRLFLSEDSPSKAGLNVQDNLQAKASWILHSDASESDDLPPGFEGSHFTNRLHEELCNIPQIKWKCPFKIGMNSDWCVAAGEESTDADAQKLRELRVLEAIYPRLTDIPSCPSVSLDIENEHYDDSLTPLIPITPIEEEEEEEIIDRVSDLASSLNTRINSQPAAIPQYIAPVLQPPAPDVSAAASAALAAIMKCNEKGNLIDPDLLIHILSNSNAIEQLSKGYGSVMKTEKPTTNMIDQPVSIPFTSQIPDFSLPSRPANGNLHYISNAMPSPPNLPIPQHPTRVTPVSLPVQETNVVSPPKPVNEDLFRVPNWGMQNPRNMTVPTPTRSLPMKAAQPMKDMNYYKNLIRQHGGEKQENTERIISQYGNHNNQYQNIKRTQNFISGDTKHKKKLCTYFNSKRGCRDGSNCLFRHEQDVDIMESRNAKRIKLG